MTEATMEDLQRAAQTLSRQLSDRREILATAESCTGGLIASTLTDISGASKWYAGSIVSYQLSAKHRWLSVEPQATAEDDAVTETVARAMVAGLWRRSNITMAAAITGHLGPNAPQHLDGVVWVAVSRACEVENGVQTSARRHPLQSSSRGSRKREAATIVLQTLIELLADQP